MQELIMQFDWLRRYIEWNEWKRNDHPNLKTAFTHVYTDFIILSQHTILGHY